MPATVGAWCAYQNGMKPVRALLLCSFFLATATLAQTPVIRSIAPPYGPTAGGTQVKITGESLAMEGTPLCPVPCLTRVLFGGQPGAVVGGTAQELTVTAPAHASGAVDVSVVLPNDAEAVRINGFTYADSAEDLYVRVLLPVYLDQPVAGGQGSRWETDFWIYNHGLERVLLAPYACPNDAVCPIGAPDWDSSARVEPRSAVHGVPGLFRPPVATPGRFLYYTKNGVGNLDFHLRIRDSSRDATNAGTEIPVVHESDLRTSTLHLINIPMDSRFRQTLRIYDGALPPTRFAVRVYDFASNALLASTTVEAVSPDVGLFRDLPPLAQIPDLRGLLPGRTAAGAVRVEVEPLSSGSHFWAFVSVTNNETQQATLVTPQ